LDFKPNQTAGGFYAAQRFPQKVTSKNFWPGCHGSGFLCCGAMNFSGLHYRQILVLYGIGRESSNHRISVVLPVMRRWLLRGSNACCTDLPVEKN